MVLVYFCVEVTPMLMIYLTPYTFETPAFHSHLSNLPSFLCHFVFFPSSLQSRPLLLLHFGMSLHTPNKPPFTLTLKAFSQTWPWIIIRFMTKRKKKVQLFSSTDAFWVAGQTVEIGFWGKFFKMSLKSDILKGHISFICWDARILKVSISYDSKFMEIPLLSLKRQR